MLNTDRLLNGAVSVGQSVRFRDEDFGCILWKNGTVLIVDQDAGVLLRRLQYHAMTIAEVAIGREAEVPSIIEVLKVVWNKGMLHLA
jgi:hypothetical protein